MPLNIFAPSRHEFCRCGRLCKYSASSAILSALDHPTHRTERRGRHHRQEHFCKPHTPGFVVASIGSFVPTHRHNRDSVLILETAHAAWLFPYFEMSLVTRALDIDPVHLDQTINRICLARALHELDGNSPASCPCRTTSQRKRCALVGCDHISGRRRIALLIS